MTLFLLTLSLIFAAFGYTILFAAREVRNQSPVNGSVPPAHNRKAVIATRPAGNFKTKREIWRKILAANPRWIRRVK